MAMANPFVDHIVGMRQFDKLCKEQTGLQILPGAVNAKRGRQDTSKRELVEETAIPIWRSLSTIINIDSDETIATHTEFATQGGTLGKFLMLGGEQNCSIYSTKNIDHPKYLILKNQVNLTYGEAK
jgi:hypothetical protein